jgi:hypothetical protein
MIPRVPYMLGSLGLLLAAWALSLAAGSPRHARETPVGFVLTKVSSIGVPEGDPARTFGDVADVAADRAGNLYVLDAAARRVRVFARDGAFLAELGRTGRGPGELLGPAALAIDSADRLYVLDAMSQRLEVFGPGPAGHRWERSIRLGFSAGDVCAAEGRLYLLGTGEGRPVREVTPDGVPVRSFGAPPGGRDPLLSASLAGGYLACSGGGILHLPMLTPELHGYSPGVGDTWRAEIPEYEAVRVEGDGESVTFTAGRSGVHDVAGSAAGLTPEYGIVQVGVLRKGATSPGELTRVKSYVVSRRDGRIRLLRADLPRIVAARDGYAFAVRGDPYPRVEVYRVDRDGGHRR